MTLVSKADISKMVNAEQPVNASANPNIVKDSDEDDDLLPRIHFDKCVVKNRKKRPETTKKRSKAVSCTSDNESQNAGNVQGPRSLPSGSIKTRRPAQGAGCVEPDDESLDEQSSDEQSLVSEDLDVYFQEYANFVDTAAVVILAANTGSIAIMSSTSTPWEMYTNEMGIYNNFGIQSRNRGWLDSSPGRASDQATQPRETKKYEYVIPQVIVRALNPDPDAEPPVIFEKVKEPKKHRWNTLDAQNNRSNEISIWDPKTFPVFEKCPPKKSEYLDTDLR